MTHRLTVLILNRYSSMLKRLLARMEEITSSRMGQTVARWQNHEWVVHRVTVFSNILNWFMSFSTHIIQCILFVAQYFNQFSIFFRVKTNRGEQNKLSWAVQPFFETFWSTYGSENVCESHRWYNQFSTKIEKVFLKRTAGGAVASKVFFIFDLGGVCCT